MKTNAPPIAKTDLVRVRASGERVSLVAEIGQPYQSAEGFWHTPVALHGVDGRLNDICGEDSLQSISLAVEMLRRRLTCIIEDGDQLLDTEGGQFLIETYFGKSHED